MNLYRKITLSALAVLFAGIALVAQVQNAGGVRKRGEEDRRKKAEASGPVISDRMQSFFENKEPHDADLAYVRQIYRSLDLSKEKNTPLYFPEDVIDGQENLFRIIMRLVVEGKIPAYEYLDGREIFSDQYKIKVGDMLDRFEIYYTQTGGNGKNPRYEIAEADVPTNQVLNYYIIEKWEFDRRSNRMKTRVEAICPVLNKYGDFGETNRYPMFWVKFDALRPWLAQEYIFLSDDNNLPQYSLDDFFNMGMYDGEIYKTQNLRNLSMMQMYPDEDDLKAARDSIDRRLRSFGKDLWVPDRDEYLAQRAAAEAAAEAAAAGDTIPSATTTVTEDDDEPKSAKSVRSSKRKRAKAKSSKPKQPKQPKVKQSSGNSNAAKSVRRRKR
ncbi:MAG: gliding motility protein GldN [Porphyromonadaceae bacterium]|nr:gliding motility protein GldN [Porphyromonadaceae bacterium]MDD6315325.1 gliding motility protein GldN [Porphyromonadaceae bacterium]